MKVSRARRRSVIWRVACLTLPCFTVAAVSGCGNGLAQVSGQVTVDGQPVHGGNGDTRVTVQFQAASGSGSTAIGLADENGNYVLGTGSQTGLPPGEYLATCTIMELIRSKDSQQPSGARRTSDPKYGDVKTSGLKFTVQPGKNEFNIPLTGPPKTPSRPGA